MTGRVVYSNHTSIAGQHNISVMGWAKGAYNVQLTSGGVTKTYKVMVK
jgi:hypothetical protein